MERAKILKPPLGEDALSSVEEAVQEVLRRSPEGKERETFLSGLLAGDALLLERALQAGETLLGEPLKNTPLDKLILEERLRQGVPPLDFRFPETVVFSSSSLVLGSLMGGVLGFCGVLLLGVSGSRAGLVGGLIGGLGGLWAVSRLYGSRFLRIVAGSVLGLGVLGEVASLLPSLGWGALVRRFSRKFSPLRFSLFLCMMPLLFSSIPTRVVDRKSLKEQLLRFFTHRFTLYLALYEKECAREYALHGKLRLGENLEDFMALGAPLQHLAHASGDSLEDAVEIVLQTARRIGFTDLPSGHGAETLGASPPEFWDPTLEATYETMGCLEPGDPVVVERPPLFFQGVLQTRGMLRRGRKGKSHE